MAGSLDCPTQNSELQTPAPPQLQLLFACLDHKYSVFAFRRYPVVATYVGASTLDPALANIDARLRDYGRAAVEADDRQLEKFETAFTDFDAAALTPAQWIDRRLALAQIAFLLRQHRVRKLFERSLDSFVDEPFRGIEWQLQGMSTVPGAGTGTDAEWLHLAQRLKSVPNYFRTARQRLEEGIRHKNTPDARMLRSYGLEVIHADADYLQKELPALAARQMQGSWRHQRLREMKVSSAAAANAYREFGEYVGQRFFATDRHGRLSVRPQFSGDRFALGAVEYDWALHNNLRIDKSAAELYDESWPIVAATRADMVNLAKKIASGHGWRMPADADDVVRAVERRLGEDAPANDAQMLASYQKTGARLLEYVRRTALFDVPDGYQLKVTLTPAPLRSSVDDAAYYAAPPLKGTGVGHFYVTPSDENATTLRVEHNSSAVAVLAAHEGFPGHDLHHRTMATYRNEISAIRFFTPGAVEDSSSMWADSMADEGWALYVEALLAEPQPGAPQGFYSPGERLYQLRAKLYRDLRVRIDTAIHTDRMRFDEAVDLFSQVVDFLPGSCLDALALRTGEKKTSCDSARRAIYRYSRWPTQALTYRLGKDAIVDLRRRAEALRGTRFSLQRFHLQWMRFGPLPSPYFADDLLRTLDDGANDVADSVHR